MSTVPPDAPSRDTVLSIIVPVFNEAENFQSLVAQIEAQVPAPFAMHVVYDFESDTTIPVARRMAETRPWLRLTHNTLGRGPSNAIKAGFLAVKSGPALVVMADLSDDLAVVPEALALYRAGYQIVCPSRYMRGGKQIGGPLLKRLLSQAAGLTLYYGAGFPTHDATNNFRLYSAELVNELGIESAFGFEIALELTAKAYRRGARVAEVPSVWRDRTSGTSNFKLWKWLPRYLHWYAYAWFSLPIRLMRCIHWSPSQTPKREKATLS